MGADFASMGGAAGGLVGGIIGNIAAGGDQDQATASKLAALAALQGVDVPTVEQMRINLQKYQSAGNLNPSLEQLVQSGQSQFSNINVDPRLKNAQMQALLSLQDRGNMGLSASDRAALNETRLAASGQAQSQNAAILNSMASRGMAGGGAELAARLSANQNAQNQAAQGGDRIAAMAQQNALQAMSQAGALGSQIRGQDYQQSADAARANDYINMFNAQNSQNVNNQNTGIQNNAQLFNLQNKQGIMNSNVGVNNQQEIHNKGLYQTVYGDQMQKARAVAGQDNSNSDYYGRQAAQTRGMYSGIGSAAGQAAGMAASGGFGSFGSPTSSRTMGPNEGPQLPSAPKTSPWSDNLDDLMRSYGG